jgi:hypothetical protein
MRASDWNQLYPVGTDVFVSEETGEEFHSKTTAPAQTREDGTHFLEVEGHLNPCDLRHVRPVNPVRSHRLYQAFNQVQEMSLGEILDMMASSGVAKVSSVFTNQDDQPVFALVMLTGHDLQRYMDALEAVEE